VTREREKSGRPPPKKRGEPLKIELPFEEALKAALDVEPPARPKAKKPAATNQRETETDHP
jgi:hypothetical protein